MTCSRCGKTMESPRSLVTAFGDGEPTEYKYYSSCRCGNSETLTSLSGEEEERARILSGHSLVDNGYGTPVDLSTLRSYFPERARRLGLN